MKTLTAVLGSFICLLVVVAFAHSKKVKPASTYFNNLCRLGDSKALDECAKKTVEDLKPQLVKGIPGLGLVSLEPLVIPRMELNEGSGNFLLNTTLRNLTMHGLGEYTVNSAHMVLDKDKYISEFSLSIPDLRMTAYYDMDGQILVIPIRGSGNCEMNFTDVTATSHSRGHVVTRNGDDYIEVTEMKWDISVKGKLRIWFYNLFNGDKRLGDATNKFLNDNAKEAFETLKHLAEEAFGQVFRDLSSKVYEVYPIKQLFIQ